MPVCQFRPGLFQAWPSQDWRQAAEARPVSRWPPGMNSDACRPALRLYQLPAARGGAAMVIRLYDVVARKRDPPSGAATMHRGGARSDVFGVTDTLRVWWRSSDRHEGEDFSTMANEDLRASSRHRLAYRADVLERPRGKGNHDSISGISPAYSLNQWLHFPDLRIASLVLAGFSCSIKRPRNGTNEPQRH